MSDESLDLRHPLRSRPVIPIQSRLRPNPQETLTVLSHRRHCHGSQSILVCQSLYRESGVFWEADSWLFRARGRPDTRESAQECKKADFLCCGHRSSRQTNAIWRWAVSKARASRLIRLSSAMSGVNPTKVPSYSTDVS